MAYWKVTYQPAPDMRGPTSRMVGGVIFAVGQTVEVTDPVLVDAMTDKPEWLVEKVEAPADDEPPARRAKAR